MRSLLKLASAAAVAVALATAGCIKSDQTITLYPGGAGKIDLKLTVAPMWAQMLFAQGGGMDGRRARDPFDMLKGQAGERVYWTHLKSEEGPQGEYSVSGTGYFEDLNELNKNAGLKVTFQPADGGGHVCELHGQLEQLAKKIPGAGGIELPTGGTLTAEQQQQIDMFKPMLAGFDMRVRVVMPGAVTSAEGLKPEARGATLTLTESDLYAMLDQKQELPKQMRIVSAAPDPKVLEPEVAQFQRELAEAKAAAAAERAGGASAKRDAPKDGGAEKKDDAPAKKDAGKKPQQDF